MHRRYDMAAAARSFGATPSHRLRVAMIGVHGRGRDHISAFRRLPGCEGAAHCDLDANVLRLRSRGLSNDGRAPIQEADLRKPLDQTDIDLVSIATPNHWHALAAIWTCQAGKHVYVEKPASHNV